MTALTVLAWDDPRAVRPLRALGYAFAASPGGAPVDLRIRSLAHFNDGPLDELLREVDLALVDYPAIPHLVALGALAPLDDAQVVAGSIGATQRSFEVGGAVWATAVDAACQVSVRRGGALPGPAPRTWGDVLRLAAERPGAVAMPLHPADALCAVLSIGYARSRANDEAVFVPDVDAVGVLRELCLGIDPDCFDLQPPAFLERVSAGQHWAYAPLVFGYARVGAPLVWGGAPVGDAGRPGTVLGGAGLAVSASGDVGAARRFAAFCATDDAARRIADATGQPAAASVWDERDGFFAATRASMDAAVVRPRHERWVDFHREAGEALVADLRRRESADAIAHRLRRIGRAHRIIQEAA